MRDCPKCGIGGGVVEFGVEKWPCGTETKRYYPGFERVGHKCRITYLKKRIELAEAKARSHELELVELHENRRGLQERVDYLEKALKNAYDKRMVGGNHGAPEDFPPYCCWCEMADGNDTDQCPTKEFPLPK